MTRYYTEYQWLLDFSCYSFFTYILSELYISLLPVKAATEVIDSVELFFDVICKFKMHLKGELVSGVGGACPYLHLQAATVPQWPLL